MRLDNLLASHRAVSGQGAGRRWLTEELNHALIIRIASEFQGFVRDLHDECLNIFIDYGESRHEAFDVIVRNSLELRRKIDRGNATWPNICEDSSRLGISLAQELRASHPRQYRGWIEKLRRLNDARNAIAHGNHHAITASAAVQPLTLGSFRIWRSALRSLASGIDKTAREYLEGLSGTRPW